jgi:predicted O-methyltransferase YrrM
MEDSFAQRAALLLRRLLWNLKFPPGNYYSPIPSNKDINSRRAEIFTDRQDLPGIDLRETAQLELVAELAHLYREFPYLSSPTQALRYNPNNAFFGAGDGVMLYSMLRHLLPSKVIEVGSGYSSALMLDVSDRFLEGKTHFTFIDPHPERLDKLLTNEDRGRHRVVRRRIQDLRPDEESFLDLGAGDILFIDSSHVSKVGSDVNFLMLEVMPQLAQGVVVHVHDIFCSFEYPKEWIDKGRAWNEIYLLRALLTNNARYEILLFNSYLERFHRRDVERAMPLWGQNPGSSIWLVRK